MTDDTEDGEYFDRDAERINNPKVPTSTEKPEETPARRYKGNNLGGYGNPPVKSQFKQGNKGGPGRTKGKGNLESALRKAIRTKFPVTRNGAPTQMWPIEILAMKTVESILGQSRSRQMLEFGHELFSKYGPQVQSADELILDLSGFSLDELDIWIGLFNRALGAAPEFSTPSPLGAKYTHHVEGNYQVVRGDEGHIRIERVEDWSEPELPASYK